MAGIVLSSMLPTGAAAQHRDAGEIRWYGAEPHVPMARVSISSGRIAPVSWVGEISSAPSSAIERTRRQSCASWSRVGVAWHAVDRWGQEVGTRVLRGREFYDVTGCYEAAFPDDPTEAIRPWRAGTIVLYAHGALRTHPSVEWRPSTPEQEAHARFVEALTALTLPPAARQASSARPSGEPAMPSIGERTMFFRVNDPGDHENGIAPNERQMAVSGGRLLVIAERSADASWYAVHVDNALATELTSNNLAYTPFAVFDMNGDGWPEVVCHESEGGGEFFGDIVISRDQNGVWRIVARSVGGSTA